MVLQVVHTALACLGNAAAVPLAAGEEVWDLSISVSL